VGILMETKTTDGASTVSAKNVLFDANSGTPLLTTVTNDFDKPIYKYSFAANWSYDGMDNAYKNTGAIFDFNINASRNLLFSYTGRTTAEVFTPGDELLVYPKSSTNDTRPPGEPVVFWVKQLTGTNEVVLMDEAGNLPASTYAGKASTLQATIVRSGRRNQQAVPNGQITSLTDPIASRKFPLFDNAWNPLIQAGLDPNTSAMSFTDCATDGVWSASMNYSMSGTNYVMSFKLVPPNHIGCTVDVTLPMVVTPKDYYLKKSGNKIIATHRTTGAILMGTINNPCGLGECMDGVLNASAADFNDGWGFDYDDVGSPNVRVGTGAATPLTASIANANPYRYGTKGIWRTQYSNVYQEQRKQTASKTKINEDGTFQRFVFYNWNNVGTNAQWTQANSITRYSPYGFELENKDALGIYSSAIYGYANSVPTAIASNAAYYETAYDGFEENASTYAAKGHLNLSASSGGVTVSTVAAHTGTKSLSIATGQSLSMTTSTSGKFFLPTIPSSGTQRYTVMAWFKVSDAAVPKINITGSPVSNVVTTRDGTIIEGWQKVETTFTTNANTGVTISFSVPGSTGTAYLDDVRIQPFKSGMKSYVYDPKTLWLLAELDNQNYATFYNYDEEGTLVQVKKETVRGVQTLQTTRSNVKR